MNIPANLLYPESFAEEAQALAKGTRLTCEVLDETALAAQGYGGLMAVGGGSARPPRLVRLTYRPRGAKTHLALVGKGITFDTGGLNLKPADGMYTMKCDMAGAAAVLAATWAIAKLGLKIKVTAYAAMAENMPSGSAYRPSDVLTIFGGKTVENGNSDAEGRLVMADALARSNADAPDLVVDVATLTGAAVVALGDRTAGVMATDDPTAQKVLDAARLAGEPFWQLPIPSETRAQARLDGRRPPLDRDRPRGRGAAWRPRSCGSSSTPRPPGPTWTSRGPPSARARPRVRSAPAARASGSRPSSSWPAPSPAEAGGTSGAALTPLEPARLPRGRPSPRTGRTCSARPPPTLRVDHPAPPDVRRCRAGPRVHRTGGAPASQWPSHPWSAPAGAGC